MDEQFSVNCGITPFTLTDAAPIYGRYEYACDKIRVIDKMSSRGHSVVALTMESK